MISWIYNSVSTVAQLGLDGTGALTGSAINYVRRKEDAWGKNHQYDWKGLCQAVQVWSAFNRMAEVLQLSSPTAGIPPTIRLVCIGAPIAMALIRTNLDPLTVKLGEKHPVIVGFARRAFCLIEDNIGNAAQVAAGVSYVAMIFFGQPLVGAFGVAWIAIGFCDRLGFEACNEKNPLNKVLLSASAILTIKRMGIFSFEGGYAMQSLSAAFGAGMGGEAAGSENNPQRQPKKDINETESTKFDLSKEDIPEDHATQISSNHLDVVETIYDVEYKGDFQNWKTLFAKSFGEEKNEIKDIVEKQKNFIHSVDRELGYLAFIKSKQPAFDAFVDKLSDPENETLHRMAKRLGNHLDKLKDEEKVHLILQFALTMDQTSGERAVYEAYSKITVDDPRGVAWKIYRALGDLREKLFWESQDHFTQTGLSDDAGRTFGVPSLTLLSKTPHITNQGENIKGLYSDYFSIMPKALEPFDKEIKQECLNYIKGLKDVPSEKMAQWKKELENKDLDKDNNWKWYKLYLLHIGVLEKWVFQIPGMELPPEMVNPEPPKEEPKKDE